jgi:hypothetical protein
MDASAFKPAGVAHITMFFPDASWSFDQAASDAVASGGNNMASNAGAVRAHLYQIEGQVRIAGH